MPRERFSIRRSAPARCPSESVMTELLDSTRWPHWQPEIVATEGPARMQEGDVARGRARMLGFGVHGVSVAAEVGESIFEEDVVVGVSMRVRYQVEETHDGCRVTHQLECDLPSGLSGRVLSFFLRARLKRMQRTALNRLIAQSEGAASS